MSRFRILFALGFIVFNTGAAQAGFEWVPPANEPADAPRSYAAPAPVISTPIEPAVVQQQPVYVPPPVMAPKPEPVDSPFMPLPSAAPPQQSQQLGPTYAAPAAESFEPIKRESIRDPQPSFAADMPAPTSIFAQTRVPETTIGVPAPQVEAYTPPEPPSPAIVRTDIPVAPPVATFSPAPAPRTSLVLPKDTPADVMQKAQNGTQLQIRPFPSQQDLSTTQMVPPAMNAPAAVPAYTQPQVFEEAVGFGSDVPLVLALRQVVPADYSYSFGPSVNPGYRVSWIGGQGWDRVVADMIAPLGYRVSIQGKTLHIYMDGAVPMRQVVPKPTPQRESSLSPRPEVFASSEPLAGDNNVDAPIVLQPVAIQAIAPPAFEPAAGDVSPMEEDPMDIAEISRRLNIMDPGSGEQSSQPEQAMAKIAKLQPHDFQAAPPAEQTLWAAHRGDSLRDVLARWSADSGAQLDWDAAYDYTVQADTSVNGTLEEAVRLLVERALGAGDKPVIAFLNGGGTPIMVVKDQAV